MAFKNLSVEEMQQVTAALVDPGNEAHQAVLRVEALKGLLPHIGSAHSAIHAVTPTEENPRVKEISDLATEVDEVHDVLARGVYGFLTESALFASAEKLLTVRDQLFPEGLAKAIRNTYRGQAGFAALMRKRLTPEIRGVLTELTVPGGKTLMDQVDAWLDAGDRLGALEEESARLEKTASPSFGAQVHDARNGWIRAMNAFVAVAEFVQLDPANERVILGPLRDAEATADDRSARRKPSDLPVAASTAS